MGPLAGADPTLQRAPASAGSTLAAARSQQPQTHARSGRATGARVQSALMAAAPLATPLSAHSATPPGSTGDVAALSASAAASLASSPFAWREPAQGTEAGAEGYCAAIARFPEQSSGGSRPGGVPSSRGSVAAPQTPLLQLEQQMGRMTGPSPSEPMGNGTLVQQQEALQEQFEILRAEREALEAQREAHLMAAKESLQSQHQQHNGYVRLQDDAGSGVQAVGSSAPPSCLSRCCWPLTTCCGACHCCGKADEDAATQQQQQQGQQVLYVRGADGQFVPVQPAFAGAVGPVPQAMPQTTPQAMPQTMQLMPQPPMMPPYAPPQQVTIDSASLAHALHTLMRAQPASLPKALKDVADPGHVFDWATSSLQNGMLSGYVTSVSRQRHRELCPRVATAFDNALEAASVSNLLSHFAALSFKEGGVSPVDYAIAHRTILERLIAAVAPIPDHARASAAAAKLLLDAIRHQADASGADVRFRTVWSSLESHHAPSTPTSLLSKLAECFMPPESFGSARHAYHEYLSSTYDMSDLSSTPSQVLAAARRIAKEHYPGRTDAQHGEEAKVLFGDWVRKMMPAHEAAFTPLKRLLNGIAFQRMTVKEWEQQLRINEQRDGDLHGFVQSLPPSRRPERRKPAQVAQVAQVSQVDASQASASGLRPLGGQQLQSPAAAVPRAIYNVAGPYTSEVPPNASGAEPPDGGADEQFQPPHIYAMLPGSKPRDPQCQALSEELERAKDDPSSPFYLKPFQIPSTKMDAAWVQLYGCADLGPPPNAPSSERSQIPVEALAAALGVPMPEKFHTHGRGRPHVGGDSCFACMFLAHLEGIMIKWYLHPSDAAAPPGSAAKPPGRQHKYVHQVFKCTLALALAHRLVRTDRDAGRGEVNAHVFTAPPRE